jgi:hypothetical protein
MQPDKGNMTADAQLYRRWNQAFKLIHDNPFNRGQHIGRRNCTNGSAKEYRKSVP